MDKLNKEELNNYISEGVITPFYEIRLQKLKKLTFSTVMKRKNPYLFKAKNIQTAEELIEYVLDAFLSSQEETIFGDLMEGTSNFRIREGFQGT